MNPCLLISFYFRGGRKSLPLNFECKLLTMFQIPFISKSNSLALQFILCSLFVSINYFLSAHKNASSILNLPFIAYLLNNYKHKVLNALKRHNRIISNPCLQGAFHRLRGQLRQQLQGSCQDAAMHRCCCSLLERGLAHFSSSQGRIVTFPH